MLQSDTMINYITIYVRHLGDNYCTLHAVVNQVEMQLNLIKRHKRVQMTFISRAPFVVGTTSSVDVRNVRIGVIYINRLFLVVTEGTGWYLRLMLNRPEAEGNFNCGDGLYHNRLSSWTSNKFANIATPHHSTCQLAQIRIKCMLTRTVKSFIHIFTNLNCRRYHGSSRLKSN